MRARLDRTLDAEMEAARAAVQRRRNLRDRLLTAEDASQAVVLGTVDGVVHAGRLTAVGTDHIAIDVAGRSRVLAIQHITSFEVCE